MSSRRNAFMFYEGARSRFGCKLKRVQCLAKSKTGRRCGKVIRRYAPFCATHCASFLGVKVFPSTMHPGDGLFALQYFHAGDPIAPLVGDRIKPSEMMRRYGMFADAIAPFVTSEYTRNGAPCLVDGACKRGIGFYSATSLMDSQDANDPYQLSDPFDCNASVEMLYLSPNKKRSQIPMNWIVATRYITKGEEIVTDYGPRFAVQTGPENTYVHTTF